MAVSLFHQCSLEMVNWRAKIRRYNFHLISPIRRGAWRGRGWGERGEVKPAVAARDWG